MTNFTYEEVNLMALYNAGSRERLIEVLTEMRTYLTLSETELRDLTDSTLDKLAGMTDAEFDELELYPDFRRKFPVTVFCCQLPAFFFYILLDVFILQPYNIGAFL